MTKVTLTKPAGGRDAGATIDVSPDVAARLVERGAASEVNAKPEPKQSEAKSKRRSVAARGVGVDSPSRPPA